MDKSVRGSGVLGELFEFSREQMSVKYPISVTINKITIAHSSHTRKIGLDVINEFEFNNNNYYELNYLKPLINDILTYY